MNAFKHWFESLRGHSALDLCLHIVIEQLWFRRSE